MTRWLFRQREEFAILAVVLLLAFIVSTALLAAHPTAREFGRLIAKKPKEDPIGIEKFFKNLGAVNGLWITAFLMGGFGALVVPGCFNPDVWYLFAPLSVGWLYMAWHSMAGAFWKSDPEDF